MTHPDDGNISFTCSYCTRETMPQPQPEAPVEQRMAAAIARVRAKYPPLDPPHDGELERAPLSLPQCMNEDADGSVIGGDTDRDWMRTRWQYAHQQSGEKAVSFHFEDSHIVGYDIGKTGEEREQ